MIKNPKVWLVYIGLTVGQTLLALLALIYIIYTQTTSSLTQTSLRVKEDIHYLGNGKWDLTRYNADPHIPDTAPLYIIAADGFVIDRWKPIKGFLDVSDTNRLLTYTSPQTITTDTNQVWRMYSKPLTQDGQLLGVITVAYYNPDKINSTDLDKKLSDSANKLLEKISLNGGDIHVENLDIRDFSYDVSFQILDKFSHIVTKNNNTNSIDRIPNFIDKSYFGRALNGPKIQIVTDQQSKEKFLLLTSELDDPTTGTVGVIVIGKSLNIYALLLPYTLILIALSFANSLLLTAAISKIIKTPKHTISRTPASIKHISFDPEIGILSIDATLVKIPYATNQYYLCIAAWSAPKRRWEADELLEKFGETTISDVRKVYDAMLLLNKKIANETGIDHFILHKNKTYFLNPEFLHALK